MPSKTETPDPRPLPNGPAPAAPSGNPFSHPVPKPTDLCGQVFAIHRLRGSRPGVKIDSQNPNHDHIVMALGVEPIGEAGTFDVEAALAKLGYYRKDA